MKTIAIEWGQKFPQGTIEIQDGQLAGISITQGTGTVDGARFAFSGGGRCRLEVTVDGERLSHAPKPTLVRVRTAEHPFTVLLRDVNSVNPIYLPQNDAVVLPVADTRSFREIAQAISDDRSRLTALQRIESEPEESYEVAATACRALQGPIWLGLSRDMRIFELDYGYENRQFFINARFHGDAAPHPLEAGEKYVTSFTFGRGIGCVQNISRRLEDGELPILHGTMLDDDVTYQFTAFVSLETTPLTADTLRGTHYLVADGHGIGHMLTESQQAEFDSRNDAEMHRKEETVLYHRVEAVNTADVPRYAWFKMPFPYFAHEFSAEYGGIQLPDGRITAVGKLNGEQMPQAEAAVLLQPGETAVFDFLFPHQPISEERAKSLGQQDVATRHAECRAFWQAKLAAVGKSRVPEARVDEMIRAGLLHLDLVAYGLEPDGPVAATIGVYNPIGSESAPIIQYFDAIGWHSLAERSIEYFLEKQHDDGFIQNFGGYMLETGPALWTMGEHYRFTRDDAWAARIAPKVIKSCDFILNWRRRNMNEEYRERGYGMMEGKVGDPEDNYRSFMLNSYGYLGLTRAAEMLAKVNPAESKRLAEEAEAFKADIRTAAGYALANAPVIPLGDGTWISTLPPWAEGNGPTSLLIDGERYWTHGTFMARDGLGTPLWAAFNEVLAPDEMTTDNMMNYQADVIHMRNVGFSQPYYSPHPRLHLQRGEVKAFLKEFYNGFAGLADRETYSFWEHYFGASPHKTHEEAWFLMQTRWMLWLEEGETLRLLAGIPRAWLEHSKRIELENVASYFGPVSVLVESQTEKYRIKASITCDTDRKPATVEIRLPHPLGRKAVSVNGGRYDAETETVFVDHFSGKAEIELIFA